MKKMKSITYRELLDQLVKLSPEQLAMPVVWWGDERGGEMGEVLILEEEYISVGEGMERRSGCADEPGFDERDVVATMPAGTPVLITDLYDTEPKPQVLE